MTYRNPNPHTVKILDEGLALTDATQIDFTGVGVTGTNLGSQVTENIPGSTPTAPSTASSFIRTADGTITRVSNYISSIALSDGRTLTVTRTGGYISSITDGTYTWAFTRNAGNQIISWVTTP